MTLIVEIALGIVLGYFLIQSIPAIKGFSSTVLSRSWTGLKLCIVTPWKAFRYATSPWRKMPRYIRRIIAVIVFIAVIFAIRKTDSSFVELGVFYGYWVIYLAASYNDGTPRLAVKPPMPIGMYFMLAIILGWVSRNQSPRNPGDMGVGFMLGSLLGAFVIVLIVGELVRAVKYRGLPSSNTKTSDTSDVQPSDLAPLSSENQSEGARNLD